ncbi:MAG TPA: hypothetical protein VIK81_04110 [Patescibacteria group bacterium]
MIDNRQSTIDNRREEKGQALHVRSGQAAILAIVFLAVIVILIGSLYSRLGNFLFSGQSTIEKEQVLHLAEAGIDKAIWELNRTGGGYTGETDTSFGAGTFTTEVTTIDSSTKKIESTAYIPNSTNQKRRKKITVRARLSSTNVSFLYGVQVGAGGLTMANNTTITGNVYSNGSIRGANNDSVITGDVFVAVGTGSNPDQENLNQTSGLNIGDLSSRTDAAQSFKVSSANIITKIALYIRKENNPSNATIRIVEDDGTGKPKTSGLTSGTLDASSVTGSFGWVEVTFSSNPALDPEKTYWLVIDIGVTNSSRYFIWGQSDDANYPNGTGKYTSDWSSGSALWSDTNMDFNFKAWIGNNINILDGMSVGGNAHANTISNSTITRDAFFQTIINSTAANYFPGSTDPPPEALPISDGQINDWKTTANDGGVHNGDYTTCISSIGPLRITGDLNLTNSCVLTLTGTIYVEGSIILGNNVIIQLDPGYGADSGVLVTDGVVNIPNGVQVNGSGQPTSFLLLLTTSGSFSPAAITINNIAGGTGLIYASNGLIDVFNNNGFKEITGFALNLHNNSGVTYDFGLANSSFTSGPGGGWQVQEKTWQILPF